MKTETAWKSVLELDSSRSITGGSERALADAIRRGADLRIFTDFRHNEHIDTESSNHELILEVSEFAVTYLLNDTWSAGIMTLRQPIHLPVGFGPRPSMSFFLYNQNGEQAIARPYLDGAPATGKPGRSTKDPQPGMPKYHTIDHWDKDTNAPSHNFVYDFGNFRYCVWDGWREVFANDADGRPASGSLDELIAAFSQGCEMKVGIRDLCSDLSDPSSAAVDHEVFVRLGPGYYYTEQRLFIAGSHPLVRVRPQVPMRYTSRGWDFGWLMLRTDGHIAHRRCDPYTLKFDDRKTRHAIRWFVR